jgi:RND family efflux transporter MFP subunit
MNRPKHLGAILAICALIAAALAAGFFWGRARSKSTEGQEEAETVTAPVRVVLLKQGKLERQISAFGSIVPAPGASQSLSVAYECQVASIAVSEGQTVTVGTPMLTVSESPDARLALEQARIDTKAAETQLAQARTRHALKLADNAQLAQAEQAFNAAQARLKSLEARGATQVLRTLAAGVVVKVPVQVGAILAPGTLLVEVADVHRLEARLGVEARDAARLRAGSSLTLALPGGEGVTKTQVRIRAVSPAINPTTRLMDVYITLPQGHPFALGQFVNGTLLAGSREALTVPYAAVLPDEGRSVIYTVRKGRAVRHEVQVLLESGDELQVAGQDLDASEPVVIQGNYELQDGMAVKVEQAP